MSKVKISGSMIREETWKKMGRTGILDTRLHPPSLVLPRGVLLTISCVAGLGIGISNFGNKWLWILASACIITFIAIKFRSKHFEGYLLRRHLMGAYVFQEQLDKWGEGTEDAVIAGASAAQEYCDKGINTRAFVIQSILVNSAIMAAVTYFSSWLKQ